MDLAPDLSNILASALAPGYMWVAFAVILIAFIIVSWVLVYHWLNYSFKLKTIRRVMYLYFSIRGALIIAMLVSLVSYSS